MGIEESSNTLIAQVMEGNNPVAGAVETFTASGTFDWRTVSGYQHHLVGKGRSNGERPTPADWGGITTFYGFSWDESGSCWKNNALHLAAVCTWDSPVGKPRGKASWERHEGKP